MISQMTKSRNPYSEYFLVALLKGLILQDIVHVMKDHKCPEIPQNSEL